MPTQEVACADDPATLLRRRRSHAVLLDGGTDASWSDGRAVFSDAPRAVLEVFASGWGRWSGNGAVQWRWGSPLAQWQQFLDGGATRLPRPADVDVAGFVTVLGYDLKHWIERLPRRHRWTATPVLFCAFYDWTYCADYRTGRAWVGAQSARELDARVRFLAAPPQPGRSPAAVPRPPSCPRPNMTREAYLRMIERAHQYIAAGDIYQVNLAQRFSTAHRPADAPALFAALRRRYAMPFGAYVDGGDWALVSNSPECLIVVDGNRAATFPIKGTRRVARGGDAGGTGGLAQDPKELAEHVMIVDLERNDLGRVCAPGSVAVTDFAAVQPYPFLQHLVSEVQGRLRAGTSLSDLIRATFPGGSVTGAPKIRALQIIEELEPDARGLYTGAIGWTDLRGRSRFSLAIRTAVLGRTGLTYHAGGGIVADSDPAREYEETLLKSEALFRALAAVP